MRLTCFILSTALAITVNAATTVSPAVAAISTKLVPMDAAPTVVATAEAFGLEQQDPFGADAVFALDAAIDAAAESAGLVYTPDDVALVYNAQVREHAQEVEAANDAAEDALDGVDPTADGYLTEKLMDDGIEETRKLDFELLRAYQREVPRSAAHITGHSSFIRQSRIVSVQRMIQAAVQHERATKEYNQFLARTANLPREVPDNAPWTKFPTTAARLQNVIARARYNGLSAASMFEADNVDILIDAVSLEIIKIEATPRSDERSEALEKAREERDALIAAGPLTNPRHSSYLGVLARIDAGTISAEDDPSGRRRASDFTDRVQAFPVGPMDALVLQMFARYPPTSAEAFTLPALQELV